MRSRVASNLIAISLVLIASWSVSGCGSVPTTFDSPATFTALRGRVFGGQQPLTGSVIQLYAVGNSGNGSSSTPLIHSTVLSDAAGGFSITGDYTCPTPSTTPVYLTATGGNPGLPGSVNNSAIALVAALGPCNTLTSSLFINIDEATTAAAAWALAPFATSLINIGATSTNLTGITNAFATAEQLDDFVTGISPNPNLLANTIVESAKLYSLADVLASCVNTDGGGTSCSSLFADVSASGTAPPTDTFGAALSVVKNPGNNVAPIFTNHVSATPPFPPLAGAPNDWTMSITYPTSTGPLSNFLFGLNGWSSFDAQGNLWGIYDYQAATASATNLTSFSRQFTQLVSVPLQPYSDGNIYTVAGLTIDPSGNIWISSAGDGNTSGTVNNYLGSVLEFDSAGNLKSAAGGYTGGGLAHDNPIAADPNGNIWVGSSGLYAPASGIPVHAGGDVALFNSAGVALSPSAGFANFQDFDPLKVAVDGNHTAWFTNVISNSTTNFSSSPYIVSVTTPTASNPTPTVNRTYFINPFSSAIAVDTNNNVWFTSGAGQVAGFDQLGVIGNNGQLINAAITGGGLINGEGMAIDPANKIWIANTNDSNESSTSNDLANPVTISEFSANAASFGSPVSIASGFGTDPNVCTNALASDLLIDSSGSLWVSAGPTINYGGLTFCSPGITTFVGLATPLKTPAVGIPQAP